jgi:hypothetical protein
MRGCWLNERVFCKVFISDELKAYEIERIRYHDDATDILSILLIQSRWIDVRIALL